MIQQDPPFWERERERERLRTVRRSDVGMRKGGGDSRAWLVEGWLLGVDFVLPIGVFPDGKWVALPNRSWGRVL